MSLPQILDFLKKDISNKDIYIATLGEDLEIPFCLPSIKEAIRYNQLLSVAGESSFYNIIIEHIFKSIVQDSWIEEAQDIPAGIPKTIVETALYLSGQSEDYLENTKLLIERYREESANILKTMKRKICSVFPAYSFDDCDNLDYPKLVELFIEAEQILLDNGIISERYSFTTKEQQQQSTMKSIAQQIKEDTQAYRDFDKPSVVDPRAQEFRRKQLERAKQEELKYKQRQRG